MSTQTLTADGNFLLNATPGEASADGLALSFTITGTNSGVLAVNTAPPGAAVSLSDVAYLNGSLAAQSAGTAITATGLAYVSAETAARGDLYLVLNWTSGTVVVNVAPSSLGNSGTSPGGTIPAADVTAGTFGANSGETGIYTVPNGLVVAAGGALVNGGAEVVGTSLVTGDQPTTGVHIVGAATANAAKAATTLTKSVTAIPNNTATTILTLTVPNSAQSGSILVRATSSLGAGGAIGANEATATNGYIISFTRTAGVNATAAISAAFGAAATAVAGAATVTGAVTVAAVAGAVGAVNTFPIQVTVVRSGGSSDNHTCVVEATILNANASGATLA